jgi:enhancing lycopene biosynthesis protein 2
VANVGVLISGCGFKDGAEIHESVATLFALARHGHAIVPIAPDIPQAQVVDHAIGQKTGESRNVRAEAARIFRSAPRLPDAAGALDALILPGGFGAVTNLCDFATQGVKCTVEPKTAALVRSMVSAGKPLGAWCIAPALVAAVLRGDPPVRLTIGNELGTAALLRQLGAVHVDCAATECVVDGDHKVVTTPAYMLARNPYEVAVGIDKAVDALCRWLQ